jgi:dsRNA-specific ribonuclease
MIEDTSPARFDRLHKFEQIGDAVILLLARELLYTDFPHIPKRKWTKILWIIVSNVELDALAKVTNSEETHPVPRWKGLASAFEARLGTIFLTQGLDEAREFFRPLVLARFDIEAMASAWRKEEKLVAVYKGAERAA